MIRQFIQKTELAKRYFPSLTPHSARHKLMWLIESDQHLMQQLIATGYTRNVRSFSPKQVGYITDTFGEPWG